MNTGTKHDHFAGCIVILVLLVLMPFTAPYQGWALWLLWNWFAVPIAPAITWHAAVGLMLLIGFLKMKPAQKDQKPNEALAVFFTIQVSVLLVVGISWAFHAIGFGAHP